MYRVRSSKKRWRRKWPWRVLFPLRVDDRYCKECGLPYHEGPVPEPTAHFRSGNIEAQLFPAGSFRRGDQVVRVGRWKTGGHRFFLSEFIPEEDLDELTKVILQARDGYRKRKRTRRPAR